MRQNELKKAAKLLAKADALAPNKPSIALLQGQVAMLTGQFEDAKQVLAHAIAVHPKNIQLRWAIAVQLRGHKNQIEHLEVIVNSVGQNIVARLALIKALIADEQLDAARDHMLVLQAQSRSLDLNFEVSMLIYDTDFATYDGPLSGGTDRKSGG